MCDCEPNQVSREAILKARKSHNCQECGQVINPGDRYQYSDYLFDSKWTTHKMCLRCLDLSNWLSESSDCCHPLTLLFQEIIDSGDIQRENPDGRTAQDQGNWISNHPDLEVISQEPLLIRVKSKEVQDA